MKARSKENEIAQNKPKQNQEAFDALKQALSTVPVLGYPDFSREFILETDASLNGLGALLSQQVRTEKSM